MKNRNILSTAAQNALPSGVRRMFELARKYDDSVNLTLGEPGFITPEHIINAAIESLKAGKTKYTPNAGIKELRDALAYKLKKENGIECDPDKNLIVTAGATQALMLAMVTLVNPGDEVIIQGPNWPDYRGQIDMVNAKAVYAMVDEKNGFKMTADLIEPLITEKTKLIIINSPSNPTGGVLDWEDLLEIAELVKKYKIFIISDETYEKIVYDGFEQKSLASIPGIEDYVLTINSFSKTYAMTGFRVGYICANQKIVENLIKLHENMIASVPEPMQMAAVRAIYHGEKDVAEMVECYDKNRHLIVEGLNRIRGFSCVYPKGAFYVFPNISEFGMSSEKTAEHILEKTHVVTSPGSAFGPGGEGYIRICYASRYEDIQEALRRLEEAFGTKE
ncbi:MAG TPA: pyridoxal phosphate-dependent aminotransferase [Clostridiaceae bacterium]|nr:pyridoxal phosphate-dependent aminotransferase [Clostridiaceae bacterium]